jgi:hypothetical protein
VRGARRLVALRRARNHSLGNDGAFRIAVGAYGVDGFTT